LLNPTDSGVDAPEGDHALSLPGDFDKVQLYGPMVREENTEIRYLAASHALGELRPPASWPSSVVSRTAGPTEIRRPNGRAS
jgi:hypothetical protein